MGLSVAISGGIILTVFMLILFSLPGLADKMFSIGDITTQVTQHEQEISKTEISIDHLSVLVGSSKVNFTLNNDGAEKLWNFNAFNLFIGYDGAISGKRTEQLSYSGECLGAVPQVRNWCVQSISNDVADPKILNSGEKASIRTNLNENLASTTAIVTLVTDNGVTFSSGKQGTKIYLGIDLSESAGAPAYTQIFTIPLTPSKTNMVHVELLQRSAGAITNGIQNRGSVSVAQTGSCSFTTAEAVGSTLFDNRPTIIASVDTAATANPTINISSVNLIDCVIRADATPTNLIIDFQTETAATTVTTELGSWYTIDVNP